MAITYELSIKKIDAAPTEGDLQDVVKILHWMYIGKETIDGEDYYGDAIGAVEINAPSSDSFTPFANLTEEQVTAWVEPKLDLVKIKADVDSQIETQKNLPTVVKINPWSNEVI
jgi:hypothetical protein|tara:strand:+ start:213 stop:554 length:342 start_codon:yes stop_codon:yes gene_type:complete